MTYSALRTSAALAVVLALSGCNAGGVGTALEQAGSDLTSGFDQLTSGALFSDGYLNRSDACYSQREQLAEHGSFFDKELVAAAATGAVAGGLIAALRGDSVWKGALIGGAVGLAGGYLLKMQQDGRSADSIIGQAFGDVQAENQKIENLLVSFRSVRACRTDQGRAIQAAYTAKSIDRATASKQMADVRTLLNEDIAKFRELAAQISENTESYASVYNEIAADNGTGSLQVRERRKGKKSVRVSRRAAKRTAGTKPGSLKGSNRRQVRKLQDECLTNVRKRDECIDEIEKAEAGTEELDLA